MAMRSIKLKVTVELIVDENIPDDMVYGAICNAFTGPEGQGLMSYPGSDKVISDNHEIDISKIEHVWGSSL